LERKFEDVRLPPGVRKGIPKVFLFFGKSGKWVLRTRGHIIHKFASKESAEQWWERFCHHRGGTPKNINYNPPRAKVRRVDMGKGSGVDRAKIAQMTKDAVLGGYEPK
jgi:hypothetical protein